MINTQYSVQTTSPHNYQKTLPIRRKILFTPYLSAQNRTKKTNEPTTTVLARFFSTIPIFQNSPALDSALQTHDPLFKTIHVSLIEPEVLWIQPKETIKLAINLETRISNEECNTLDPENPLLNTNQDLALKDLTRFRTITPFWWNKLKTKRTPLPTTGILIKKNQNEIHFLKGTSFIRKVTLEPNSIRIHFLWMSQELNWDANDLLLLFAKMTVIKPN